ncbi:MAG TPA: TlpA disulfide reductase family protein, partial [Myxococcota bacterium]|nr:TlpA disulfide reductase family protein [Myxococcota bacterium]
LWASTARGEALEQAQKEALEAAERAVLSPRRAEVDAARIAAEAAGEEGLAERLGQHLLLLDPSGPSPQIGPFRERLEAIEQVPQGNRQLLLLESLRAGLPPSGAQAARWYAMRGNSLASLGRLEEAWRSYSRAFDLAPRVYGTLWLQVAAREGYQPRKALRYLNHLLNQPPDLPLVLGEDQRDVGLAARATLYRLQGELYLRLALPVEAANSWRLSLLMQEDSGTHLKLGMLLSKQPGQEEEALAELLRGLASAPPGSWTREKATALELWKRGRWWDPQGMPALVEALARLQAQAPPPPTAEESASFPDLSFRVAGQERRISDYSGPMVVDVWASWCRPCLEGLPRLEELARAFPQVTVLALSVDEKEATLLQFFSARPTPAFTLGWAGVAAMQSLGISTIPTTYVLDAQ